MFVVFKSDFASHESSDNWALLDFDRSEYFSIYLGACVALGMAYNAGNIQDFQGESKSGNNSNVHISVAIYDNTLVDVMLDFSDDLGDGSESDTFNGSQNGIFHERVASRKSSTSKINP